MARDAMHIMLDEIVVSDRHRPVDADAVAKLAKSIKSIGLQYPITVRSKDGAFELVAGRHRVEAHRALGFDRIAANVVRWSDLDARMWEISENLHRAELTVSQRAEQVAEFVRLAKEKREREKPAQLAQVSGGRGNEGGDSLAARELGITREEVRRAEKIDAIAPEAKEAAKEAGLDDNQSALLRVAARPASEQVAAVHEIAEARRTKVERDVKERAATEVAEIIAQFVPADAWDGLKANLYAAGANNIANALTNVTGHSIMDARFAE